MTVIDLQSRRSLTARAELTRRGFPVSALESAIAETQTEQVTRIEREIFAAERALLDARAWLKRARGAGKNRAQATCEELMQNLQRLERVRLRLVGAEVCVLRGGRGV